MRPLFVDHYDSFSLNLISWLESLWPDDFFYEILPYDQIDFNILSSPRPLVLSPGPGFPSDHKQSIDLASAYLGKAPIFGVCLGHQILGTLGGGKIHRSRYPLHGACKQIIAHEKKSPWFQGFFEEPRNMASYHSLVVTKPTVLGWKDDLYCEQGEIQGLSYTPDLGLFPAFSVQFHPESFLSDQNAAKSLLISWNHLIRLFEKRL